MKNKFLTKFFQQLDKNFIITIWRVENDETSFYLKKIITVETTKIKYE